jgi:hypothetical protein
MTEIDAITHPYIKVISRAGHYNFCDPSQESVSTHISIMNPDGGIMMHCNITTDYEIFDNDPVQLLELVKSDAKRYMIDTARPEKERVRNFLNENWVNLYLGNLQHERQLLVAKKAGCEKRLEEINKTLSDEGHFEKGAWKE